MARLARSKMRCRGEPNSYLILAYSITVKESSHIDDLYLLFYTQPDIIIINLNVINACNVGVQDLLKIQLFKTLI